MTVLQREDWASKCSRRLLTFAGSISLDFEFTVTFLVASTGGVWERVEYLSLLPLLALLPMPCFRVRI